MKLVRFELKEELSGTPRTGMLHGGRVYETQEGEAVGIHEAADVRPLAPIERPASIRLFSRATEEEESTFTYANPGAVVGPSQLIALPESNVADGPYTLRTYLGAIVTDAPTEMDAEDAERAILGYTLLSVATLEFAARNREGRAFDVGIAVGPVITTPDELTDAFDDRGYDLSTSIRVAGTDSKEGRLMPLNPTLPQAIAMASRTSPLRAGEIIAVGPIFPPMEYEISPGDELSFSVERLGMLTTKFSSKEEDL